MPGTPFNRIHDPRGKFVGAVFPEIEIYLKVTARWIKLP
jgi:hypothetical protein